MSSTEQIRGRDDLLARDLDYLNNRDVEQLSNSRNETGVKLRAEATKLQTLLETRVRTEKGTVTFRDLLPADLQMNLRNILPNLSPEQLNQLTPHQEATLMGELQQLTRSVETARQSMKASASVTINAPPKVSPRGQPFVDPRKTSPSTPHLHQKGAKENPGTLLNRLSQAMLRVAKSVQAFLQAKHATAQTTKMTGMTLKASAETNSVGEADKPAAGQQGPKTSQLRFRPIQSHEPAGADTLAAQSLCQEGAMRFVGGATDRFCIPQQPPTHGELAWNKRHNLDKTAKVSSDSSTSSARQTDLQKVLSIASRGERNFA